MLAAAGYGLIPIDKVDPATAKLDDFHCNRKNLDDFLVKSALTFHTNHLGFTNLVFHKEYDGLVGYFTLSNDALHLETAESFELGLDSDISLGAFPAIKIGKFAVQSNLQKKGVGTAMMNLLVGECLDSGSLSAARLLVTDAVNENDVLGFYGKCGFQKSLWAEKRLQNSGPKKQRQQPETIKMYMDVFAWLKLNKH